MNIYCEVVVSGQETGSESFVGPCHMTRERRRDKEPLYKSEKVNEFLSSVELRPKARLHGLQTHMQVLSLAFAFSLVQKERRYSPTKVVYPVCNAADSCL